MKLGKDVKHSSVDLFFVSAVPLLNAWMLFIITRIGRFQRMYRISFVVLQKNWWTFRINFDALFWRIWLLILTLLNFQVENRRVNVEYIQDMIRRRSPGSNVDVASVVEKCGSTGIDPDHLATCYQTSTLIRCIFGHLRELTSTKESELTRFFER